MNKSSVLFLCAHNAARSQMAEGLLRKYAGARFDVVSAGIEPTAIHPLTIRVMNEIGVDLSGHSAKGLDGLLGRQTFQFAIIVCERTQKNCPSIFPFALQRLYWPFEDPAEARGSEEEQLQKFRDVRDQIDTQILNWLKTVQPPLQP
ncbi:MAG TPA: arsenate reductase ArsC [Candidatus Binatia bacterium]|jgi:arsenate reductase|nr:arsenate reductase ArsC [Candidatus Binatia bacterium]